MARIAIDAMTAERGVNAVVAGAREAAAEDIEVTLVGDPDQLDSAVSGASRGGQPTGRLRTLAATEVIGNDEEPVRAVRGKPDASVVVAARAVARGDCDALVSAGSTGATLAAAVLGLKRLKGVRRPAVGALLPLPGAPTLFLDVGANVEVRSDQLVQFAYMGAAFATASMGIERPRLGLLSIGEEAGKGTEQVVDAHGRLAASDAPNFEFIGNIEGRDLTAGVADVVITDGFTGNIALKLMEGTAKTVIGAIGAAARSTTRGKIGGLLLKGSLGRLRGELDPNTAGGAILLGLNAPVVIAHGDASSTGLANAIRAADRSVRERLVERTATALERGGAVGAPHAAAVGGP